MSAYYCQKCMSEICEHYGEKIFNLESKLAAAVADYQRLREALQEAISTATSGYRAGAVSVEKWKSILDGGK
jgi:hypothetical protein